MTSSKNGKGPCLYDKDKSRAKYMIEINISQLEIICHLTEEESIYLPLPTSAHVTNPGSFRTGKLGILILPALWKERRFYKDTESHGPGTMVDCVS